LIAPVQVFTIFTTANQKASSQTVVHTSDWFRLYGSNRSRRVHTATKPDRNYRAPGQMLRGPSD